MHGYLRQIDSLNTINSNLQKQNVAYKKEISTANLRADVAEEKASEAETKVRIGAVIRSSGIRMVALNDKSKEVKRIKYASRLRVDFELTANELAEPGEKSIYICITAPDGYVLSSEDMILFMYEGDVYVKRKDDVVKLGDPTGLDHTKDLKAMLTAESYNNVEAVFLEGLRKKDIGKNYVYGYDDDKGTIWTKAKVKIDKAGNEAIKAAADTVSNDTVFKLNDDYYLKVGTDDGYAVYAIDKNNVNGQKKALAEYAKNHAGANFAEAKKEEIETSMTISNRSKAKYEPEQVIGVSYTDDNSEEMYGELQIKHVYEVSGLSEDAKAYVEGADAGTLFVYKNEVYLVGRKGDRKVICSVRKAPKEDSDIIQIIKDKAGSDAGDGSNPEPQGFYGSNLVDSGKTAAASTSGGRGWNYAEMV
jgi:hypothetical protein